MKNFMYYQILFLLFVSNSLFAQVKFYITPDKIRMTEQNYLQVKKDIDTREDLKGQYQEVRIKTEHRNDTVINYIKFEKKLMAFGADKKMYDPYDAQRKLINEHFPIELFKNQSNGNYAENYLKGKPTIVNFWFTSCPPCIKEIPDLNKLKKHFGDNVNFVAITFDGNKKVDKFLKKWPLNDFEIITNAQNSINRLKIRSYPMTFLLNKEGEIINVYGALMGDQTENLKELISFML